MSRLGRKVKLARGLSKQVNERGVECRLEDVMSLCIIQQHELRIRGNG